MGNNGVARLDNQTLCDFSDFRATLYDSSTYMVNSVPNYGNGGSDYTMRIWNGLRGLWNDFCTVFARDCSEAYKKLQICYDKKQKDPVKEVAVEYQGMFGISLDESTKEYVRDLMSGKGCYEIILTDRMLPMEYEEPVKTKKGAIRKKPVKIQSGPAERRFELQLSCYLDERKQALRTFCSVETNPSTSIKDALKKCNPSSTIMR